MSKEKAILNSPSKVDDWLDKSRPYMHSSEQPMSMSSDVPCGKHCNIHVLLCGNPEIFM